MDWFVVKCILAKQIRNFSFLWKKVFGDHEIKWCFLLQCWERVCGKTLNFRHPCIPSHCFLPGVPVRNLVNLIPFISLQYPVLLSFYFMYIKALKQLNRVLPSKHYLWDVAWLFRWCYYDNPWACYGLLAYRELLCISLLCQKWHRAWLSHSAAS